MSLYNIACVRVFLDRKSIEVSEYILRSQPHRLVLEPLYCVIGASCYEEELKAWSERIQVLLHCSGVGRLA